MASVPSGASLRPCVHSKWLRRLVTTALTVVCLLGYTVAVTYDVRCWRLAPTLLRYVHYPLDPSIAAAFGPLPADPRALEQLVSQRVADARDIDVYGIPWYFATPRETLAHGAGDCEASTMVLASLLTAQRIPFVVRASFSHMWVDYAGRTAPAGERVGEAVLRNDGGHYSVRWPLLPELREHLLVQKDLLWDGLAPARQGLLLLGWPVILLGVPLRRRRSCPP